MDKQLSVFNLKCLKCSGNLQITDRVSEFACQYCGAFQIVVRHGGIVTLELISEKIDRVQNSVNAASAELKIQRLNFELKELDETYEKLETSLAQMKSSINPLAVTIIAASFIPFFISAAYTGSIIPIIPGIILSTIFFGLWRKKINKLDSDFNRSKINLDKKAVEIKEEISQQEKILNRPLRET
jgi:uncharacterized protein YacL